MAAHGRRPKVLSLLSSFLSLVLCAGLAAAPTAQADEPASEGLDELIEAPLVEDEDLERLRGQGLLTGPIRQLLDLTELAAQSEDSGLEGVFGAEGQGTPVVFAPQPPTQPQDAVDSLSLLGFPVFVTGSLRTADEVTRPPDVGSVLLRELGP